MNTLQHQKCYLTTIMALMSVCSSNFKLRNVSSWLISYVYVCIVFPRES
jgi:hypothetical protein